MEKQNEFPLSAGFLFPNGEYYSTDGKGHENTAYRILRDEFGLNILEITYPEGVLQEQYSALLIRYRYGEKLIYLPKTAPKTYEQCRYLKKAIKFYRSKGFQIINVYHISLDNGFSNIKEFLGETFEEIKSFSFCINYTQTVVTDSKGNYMYNPERIGD